MIFMAQVISNGFLGLPHESRPREWPSGPSREEKRERKVPTVPSTLAEAGWAFDPVAYK